MREVEFCLPEDLDARLQERYALLVKQHLNVSQPDAAGAKALPGAASAFACTQAAWRFYNNENVSLPGLAEPLLTHAHTALQADCQRYGLVVHDWSSLTYRHQSKKDRAVLQHKKHRGYELQEALLLSDKEGQPLVPLVQEVRSNKGLHSTRSEQVLPRQRRLDTLTERMEYLEDMDWEKPLVHIIDREADSVGHYRQWNGQKRRFLVRAKGRQRIRWSGQECLLKEVVQPLAVSGAFQWSRQVDYEGTPAEQYVAETTVVLERAARPNHKGKSSSVAGAPLELRLIVSQVRDKKGQLLATWLLLSQVESSVSAGELALWYYWRWRVESFFKLLKSAGHQLESWQQETGLAVARRLLVASMACVVVWQIARDPSPQAQQSRELLVRLSGRQMKHGCSWTHGALLAGLWSLLAILDLLEHADSTDVKALLGSLTALLDVKRQYHV
jgi:hypothetical protein